MKVSTPRKTANFCHHYVHTNSSMIDLNILPFLEYQASIILVNFKEISNLSLLQYIRRWFFRDVFISLQWRKVQRKSSSARSRLVIDHRASRLWEVDGDCLSRTCVVNEFVTGNYVWIGRYNDLLTSDWTARTLKYPPRHKQKLYPEMRPSLKLSSEDVTSLNTAFRFFKFWFWKMN